MDLARVEEAKRAAFDAADRAVAAARRLPKTPAARPRRKAYVKAALKARRRAADLTWRRRSTARGAAPAAFAEANACDFALFRRASERFSREVVRGAC